MRSAENFPEASFELFRASFDRILREETGQFLILKGRVNLANHDKDSEKGPHSEYGLEILEKVSTPAQSHHIQAFSLAHLLKAELN